MRHVLYAGAVALGSFGLSLAVLESQWLRAQTAPDPVSGVSYETALMQDVCSAEMANSATHTHTLLEIADGTPVPTITHLVFPDDKDGYNIQILTENFTFSPSMINREPAENEGHAHLYVNGQKVQRVYGHWVHLPSDALVPGANAVRVTLNANDHSEWAFQGVAISSTVIVFNHGT